MFINFLSLHSADIAQDHRLNLAYLCGKQIQGKKTYPSAAKNMVKYKA